MIFEAWCGRFVERRRRDPLNGEREDVRAVAELMRRLQDAHESGDTASTRRWLHAVQVAVAACAPSHQEAMRLALGDVVGLLGLDDINTEEV